MERDDELAPDDPYEFERPEPIQPPSLFTTLRRWVWPLAGLVFLLLKFGKVAFIAIKSGKFGLTLVSMVVSIGGYALLWGWKFAVGFVLLIFVHELGHALQLRREGMQAGAPVFIPFLGAAIAMRDQPRDALVEARVGLAGPILGSLAALVVYAAALQYDSDFLQALAYTGFFLNLFNLLPISPLDGGRAMAAVSPSLWLLGVALMITLVVVWGPNPILVLIVLLSVFETWERWRGRKQMAAYYQAVTPSQRAGVLAVYLGLIAALYALMQASFLERSL